MHDPAMSGEFGMPPMMPKPKARKKKGATKGKKRGKAPKMPGGKY